MAQSNAPMSDNGTVFCCPHCGQQGKVVWRGEREPIGLSSGFHVEEGRLPDARHVIICDACDEIDPLGLLDAHA